MKITPELKNARRRSGAIFETLRRDILAGRFAAGEKLPGSRSLATRLGVARGTVNMALARLAAEGLIEIKNSQAARVAVKITRPPRDQKISSPTLSGWARRLPVASPDRAAAFFASGILDQENFPEREWLACVRKTLRQTALHANEEALSAAGYRPLREAIAAHLKYSRGLDASAENIVIVNGSMQAIALIAQLLLEAGDTGAFENPGFHGIRAAFHATGAALLPVPLDREGMTVPSRKAKIVVVTPASQFPTGIQMTHSRRAALLAYARKCNAVVVEDEYDSEFSRFKNPPQPMKLIDQDDRVIYIGSFSRTMFASLRIGYALLPRPLVEPFVRARRLYETVPPAVTDQAAMAEFMLSGKYRSHLRRMNKIYSERHDALLETLGRYLDGFFSFTPSSAGLSLFGRWQKSREDFVRYRSMFADAGIAWQDVERYYSGRPPLAAIFGFSHLDKTQLAALAEKLRRLA